MNDPVEVYFAVYLAIQRNKPAYVSTKEYVSRVLEKEDDIPEFWRSRYNKRLSEIVELKGRIQELEKRTDSCGETVFRVPQIVPSPVPNRPIDYTLNCLSIDVERDLRRRSLQALAESFNEFDEDIGRGKLAVDRLYSLFVKLNAIYSDQREIFDTVTTWYLYIFMNDADMRLAHKVLEAMVAMAKVIPRHSHVRICQVITDKFHQIKRGYRNQEEFKIRLCNACFGFIKALEKCEMGSDLRYPHIKELLQLPLAHRVHTRLVRILQVDKVGK